MTELLSVLLETDNDIQYMNMNDPMSHERSFVQKHLDMLVEVLKKGKIWSLNIGEIGTIGDALNWKVLVDNLEHTNITHLYISDRQVGEDKKKVLGILRQNRSHAHTHTHTHTHAP